MKMGHDAPMANIEQQAAERSALELVEDVSKRYEEYRRVATVANLADLAIADKARAEACRFSIAPVGLVLIGR